MPGCARVPVNALCPEVGLARRGAELIRRGKVIAAPTDTLYGLLANAGNRKALLEVFRIKGRPENKPVLLLIDSRRRIPRIAREIPEAFEVLADAFWPGPLTIVLPARPEVSSTVTAGRDTVAVRVPRSPLVRALARQAGCPLTGTSANLSGRPGARSASEVFAQLGRRLPLLLDGGRIARPAPSTILDLASDRPRILREGRVGSSEIARALRQVGLGLRV